MSYYDVLVVGAGPVGQAFTIEASRKGLSVKVIDKNIQGARHSNAIGINSRTLELLSYSGVTEKLLNEGQQIKVFRIVDKNLKPLLELQMKNTPGKIKKFVALSQVITEKIMTEHLFENYGVKIDRPTELISFEELTDQSEQKAKGYNIRSIIQQPDGNKQEIYSKYLLGADGVHSQVRKTLGIEYQGFQIEQSLNLIEGKIDVPFDVEGVFFVMNPKNSATQPFLLVITLGDGYYRLGAPKNTLANVPEKIKVNSVDWDTTFQSQIRQAEKYQKGHVFIAGDAAHCHSPVGGRGMNLGIEDAVVLAALIKSNRTDEYYNLRHPIGEKVLADTTGLFRIFAKEGLFWNTVKKIACFLLEYVPGIQSYLLYRQQGLNVPKLYDIIQ